MAASMPIVAVVRPNLPACQPEYDMHMSHARVGSVTEALCFVGSWLYGYNHVSTVLKLMHAAWLGYGSCNSWNASLHYSPAPGNTSALCLCDAGVLCCAVQAVACRFYLNSFYPPDQVTLPYSLVEAAVGLANVVAAPLAASLLMLDGKSGMHGWQW